MLSAYKQQQNKSREHSAPPLIPRTKSESDQASAYFNNVVTASLAGQIADLKILLEDERGRHCKNENKMRDIIETIQQQKRTLRRTQVFTLLFENAFRYQHINTIAQMLKEKIAITPRYHFDINYLRLQEFPASYQFRASLEALDPLKQSLLALHFHRYVGIEVIKVLEVEKFIRFLGAIEPTGRFTLKETVDWLESETNYRKGRERIETFGEVLNNDIYQSSYLTYAIVWGRLKAAIDILTLCGRQGINYQPARINIQNTPLILCAKTHATAVASFLLGLGADPNITDASGSTALHYACMHRNDKLIDALLAAGAESTHRNRYDKTPLDYYSLVITHDDLQYHYGEEKGELIAYGDVDLTYQGTVTPDYSIFRWFIGQIIVNMQLGKEEKFTNKYIALRDEQRKTFDASSYSLHDLAKIHLNHTANISDSHFYKKLISCFTQARHKIEPNEDIINRLHEENTFKCLTSNDTPDMLKISTMKMT